MDSPSSSLSSLSSSVSSSSYTSSSTSSALAYQDVLAPPQRQASLGASHTQPRAPQGYLQARYVSADSVFYYSSDDDEELEGKSLVDVSAFDHTIAGAHDHSAPWAYQDRRNTTSTPFDSLPLPLRYVVSAVWWGNTVLEVDEGSAGELILTTRKSCFPSCMMACSSLFHCGVCKTYADVVALCVCVCVCVWVCFCV
jgi:hypothetical protein